MNLILFDGECPLCHRLVRFLAKRTSAEELFFAPLGGETSIKFGFEKDFPSVVYISNFKTEPVVNIEGKAALKALSLIKGPFRVAALFASLPKWMINPPYRWVSRMRKKSNKKVLPSLKENIFNRLLS